MNEWIGDARDTFHRVGDIDLLAVRHINETRFLSPMAEQYVIVAVRRDREEVPLAFCADRDEAITRLRQVMEHIS